MYKTGSTAKICLVSCAGFFVCRESMQNRGHNRKKEEYFMNRHVCFYVPQHVLENIARYRALEERGDVSEIRRSIQISEAMRQSRRQSAERRRSRDSPRKRQSRLRFAGSRARVLS